MIAAIVPSAGKGKRLKARVPEPFFSVAGRPILAHTLAALKKSGLFGQIIVAVEPSRIKETVRLLKKEALGRIWVVAGGSTRAASVKKALASVAEECEWVLVHDAARPLLTRSLIRRTLSAARKTGAALCAMPVAATVKKADPRSGIVRSTEDRRQLFLAQTPQVFRKSLLAGAYKRLGARALERTDEAALFDGSSTCVRIVEGESDNIKITTPADIELFQFYLKRRKK